MDLKEFESLRREHKKSGLSEAVFLQGERHLSSNLSLLEEEA